MCVGFGCVCRGDVAVTWVLQCFIRWICNQVRICVFEMKMCVACGLGVKGVCMMWFVYLIH